MATGGGGRRAPPPLVPPPCPPQRRSCTRGPQNWWNSTPLRKQIDVIEWRRVRDWQRFDGWSAREIAVQIPSYSPSRGGCSPTVVRATGLRRTRQRRRRRRRPPAAPSSGQAERLVAVGNCRRITCSPGGRSNAVLIWFAPALERDPIAAAQTSAARHWSGIRLPPRKRRQRRWKSMHENDLLEMFTAHRSADTADRAWREGGRGGRGPKACTRGGVSHNGVHAFSVVSAFDRRSSKHRSPAALGDRANERALRATGRKSSRSCSRIQKILLIVRSRSQPTETRRVRMLFGK